MVPAFARFVQCSMGFTTSYWQKERWSRRAADTLTNYELCWNPSLALDVNWHVGVNITVVLGSARGCGSPLPLCTNVPIGWTAATRAHSAANTFALLRWSIPTSTVSKL